MKRQIHVYYTGRVQGVGFRFSVENIANELNIYGWVKNWRDGRVEITAEADEESLNCFLDKIKAYFSRYIHNVNIDWQEATGEFTDFTIRF